MIFTTFYAIYFVLFLLYSTLYLVYYQLLGLQGLYKKREEAVYTWLARWCRHLINLTRGQVQVEGLEYLPNHSNILFVSNHQSYFDILLIFGFIPGKKIFIGKIETKKVPILRTWMRLSHCIFMDRKDVRQSLKSILQGIEYIQQGLPVVIFPEGTRSQSATINPFKAGSMKLATKSNATIVPITLDGSYQFFEEHRRIKPAHVKVVIHPPIETVDLTSEQVKTLAQDLQIQIESKIQK
ncbi:MAG: 1-acyl-sn-glycerol-3-phosphate acyltransferase [Epulopiscium sp.]|nr:1-acyl-sn-glycerol-3-phosphate acyltransferase [Candidatus Epulonipiscium sp.]